MIRSIASCLLVMSAVVFADGSQAFITYTPEETLVFKNNFIQEVQRDPLRLGDLQYDMPRTLKTIRGTDCDDIPKVQGAGQIFSPSGQAAYQLLHNGIKIVPNCYYNVQFLTDVIYGLKGHHEPQEEKCFYEIMKHIPENATMIELGAYWAYYSLWFLFDNPTGKTYLIEPDVNSLEVGKRNFALNHKQGKFFRGYIGSVDPEHNNCAAPGLVGAERIFLDRFIEEQKIDHVHILHADIQGGEYEMLLSIKNHLDKIDYFFISTHDDQKFHFPCLQFLQDNGFVILAEHTRAHSCSGDGLIVAKRPNVPGPDHITINQY